MHSHSETVQGVVTPICAVVTAKTGVEIFWPSFMLLDRLTTLQKGSWPFDHIPTNPVASSSSIASWPLKWVYNLSLTAWPHFKKALDRLTIYLPTPWLHPPLLHLDRSSEFITCLWPLDRHQKHHLTPLPLLDPGLSRDYSGIWDDHLLQ